MLHLHTRSTQHITLNHLLLEKLRIWLQRKGLER
jgi:hypothetical protein